MQGVTNECMEGWSSGSIFLPLKSVSKKLKKNLMELEEEEVYSGGIDAGQTKTPDGPCSMYHYPHFTKIATAEPRLIASLVVVLTG